MAHSQSTNRSKSLANRLPAILVLLLYAGTALASNPVTDGLSRLGTGELRWFGLKIYTASIWTGPLLTADAIAGQRTKLQIVYHRNVSSERLFKSTREEWVHLHGEPGTAASGWLDQLQAIYPNVQPNSRFAAIVEPNGPTSFYLNDIPAGSITAKEFGPAFLAIWLDPATSRPGLRSELLALEQ